MKSSAPRNPTAKAGKSDVSWALTAYRALSGEEGGGTAFHFACGQGHADCAEELLRAGCDAGQRDSAVAVLMSVQCTQARRG